MPRLDAPATPEAILMAVDDIKARDTEKNKHSKS
jgi:xanthine dehydrogenase molybdopterin-binding subunit B